MRGGRLGMTLLLLLAAVLAAVVTAYAQARIPDFTRGGSKATMTRVILGLVGLAVGYLGLLEYPNDPLAGALSFIVGVGVVHTPAAIILFLKAQRRSGKS